MDTAEIRRRFLAHFEAAGHAVVDSASTLANDPNHDGGQVGPGRCSC